MALRQTLAKLYSAIRGAGVVRVIPDYLENAVGEIKDVQNLGLTAQLEAEISAAERLGKPFHLIVSPRAVLSRILEQKILRSGGRIAVFDPIRVEMQPYIRVQN
ncbi:MAG: hypothetical protein K1X75_16885 [Leptospirales bacterium]|nr:hypothetical protein [Leptospirales bacterium]